MSAVQGSPTFNPTSSSPSHDQTSPSPNSPSLATTPTPITSPTIYVHYGARHVKARIDHQVPLEEIIRQLTASSQLQITEPAALFALRVKETGQLVTSSNLDSLLLSHSSTGTKNVFTLCSSPTIEAVETIDKLSSSSSSSSTSGGGGDQKGLKLATFSLKTLIKDEDFLKEFLKRDGFNVLEGVVERTNGNTLAYALNVVRDLTRIQGLEIWRKFSRGFGRRLVEIVATQPLINISRPATSILLYLVHQSSSSSHETGFSLIHPHIVSSSRRTDPAEEGEELSKFLPNLISHLPSPYSDINGTEQSELRKSSKYSNLAGGGNVTTTNSLIDTEFSESSLALLDGLLRGFTVLHQRDGCEDESKGELMGLEQFRDELRGLGLYRIVASILNPSTTTPTPESPLLSLANSFLSTYQQSLQTSYSIPFSPEIDSSWLDELPTASKLDPEQEAEEKWRRIGWKTETPEQEVSEYWRENGGAGGREALKSLVEWARETDGVDGETRIARVIREEVNTSSEKRLPTPYVSFEITRLLARRFNLLPSASSSKTQSPTATTTALLFELKELHRILMEFWIKLSREINSSGEARAEADSDGTGAGEWEKIKSLVESQFEFSVGTAENEGGEGSKVKTLQEIETEFEKSDYKSIRSRQIEEFEKQGDEILSKKPIQRLRSRIYRECFEFLKQQRINSLLEGIWVTTTTTNDSTTARWRFLRLSLMGSSTRKSLNWIEVGTKEEKEVVELETRERGGTEWFAGFGGSGKIELSSIQKITTSTSSSTSSNSQHSEPAPSSVTIPNTATRTGPSKLHRRTASHLAASRTGATSSFVPPSPAAQAQARPPRSETSVASTPSYSITLHLSSSPPVTFSTQSSSTHSELLDSLYFLLQPSNPEISIEAPSIPSKETLEYVTQLVEIELKVKLLDLTGEGIEILDFDDDLEGQDGGGVEYIEDDEEGMRKGGMGMVRCVPSEEERFYYREYI
ncbi:uncharacterized protein JCM6883_001171 [Sporobolomyces salmoneus]|uniref:uncharacterized protein n=1 Tax=Sporobolomyces salmoneus TaxID=183962 RepID=UPI003171879A